MILVAIWRRETLMNAKAAADAKSTTPIRVVVAGSTGSMGRMLMRNLGADGDITVVGGFHRTDPQTTVDSLLATADVMFEFTHAPATKDLLLRAIAAGVRPVSGTSGVTEETLAAVDAAARNRGIAALWASNFDHTAVMMQHLARIAARSMDAVEIIEAHGQHKKDSPSGTALALAKAMRQARGSDFPDPHVEHHSLAGTRGGITEGGIRVHAIRLPAAVGWHEAIFSTTEGTLILRTEGWGDNTAPVLARAAREVMRTDRTGLIRGAETLFGLPES